jgi:hypothetical protein
VPGAVAGAELDEVLPLVCAFATLLNIDAPSAPPVRVAPMRSAPTAALRWGFMLCSFEW